MAASNADMAVISATTIYAKQKQPWAIKKGLSQESKGLLLGT